MNESKGRKRLLDAKSYTREVKLRKNMSEPKDQVIQDSADKNTQASCLYADAAKESNALKKEKYENASFSYIFKLISESADSGFLSSKQADQCPQVRNSASLPDYPDHQSEEVSQVSEKKSVQLQTTRDIFESIDSQIKGKAALEKWKSYLQDYEKELMDDTGDENKDLEETITMKRELRAAIVELLPQPLSGKCAESKSCEISQVSHVPKEACYIHDKTLASLPTAKEMIQIIQGDTEGVEKKIISTWANKYFRFSEGKWEEELEDIFLVIRDDSDEEDDVDYQQILLGGVSKKD